ncbi:MAG TPA: glutaredoxin domain-containing protein [Desulfuromonadaceae bacterium]
MTRSAYAALALTLFTCISAGAEGSHQSGLNTVKAEAAKQYPQIVLYSVAWCPHCREAKGYLTKNDIPFINRDVEVDAKAMEELTIKYNSTGVPVIVFGKGDDEVIMKGFTPELFQETLKKARSK